jgi:uncharacterized membrane protein YhaH (DUF805 family)
VTVLKFLFSSQGRIGRAWYWLIQILQVATAFVLLSAVSALPWGAKFEQSLGMQVSVGAVIAIYGAMWFATHAKRWHDLGRSGWSMLIWFIPVVGAPYVLIMCGFVRGDAGPNAYSSEPLPLLL